MSVREKNQLPLSFLVLLFPALLCGRTAAQPQADTTKQASKPLRRQSLEGPVVYEARHIRNLMTGKQTVLTGNAKISYQDMTLTAARITVDWDSRTVLAEAVMDSVWARNESGDSTRAFAPTGLPEFAESGDVMRGEAMTYNFQTRRGRVLRGRTQFEDGFYTGTALKMMDRKTLNVADGRFTTCDNDSQPHFHFWSKRMKVIVNDKVIAKPIILFAGRIPVLALPFGLFPVKRGRHSGVLIPRYGESATEGRYLRGIGYYWAPSEYWDIRPTVDYFENSGFLFGADMNYNVRYRLSGAVSGSWTRKNFSVSGLKERRWDLSVRHSQVLSPTAQLSVSGNLVSSGNFYREVSPSREHRLQQKIFSNATFTKKFGGSWSLTANLNQTKNLKTDEVTESLPQVSIRGGQTPFFPKPKAGRGGNAWYRQMYWSYSSTALARRSVRLVNTSLKQFSEQQGRGWDHQLRFSSTQKLFGWLSLNPSMNVRETWTDRRKSYVLDPGSNKAVASDETGFHSRRVWDVTASFGTKLYGTFYPRLLKETVIRHVATPTVGYGVQPDFSKSGYGYFQTVTDTAGRVTEYDRYDIGLFSGTPREGRRGLTFGLQNLFQMKVGEGEKARKFDLFNYDLSGSYNWKAKQYKMSDLQSSFRASPLSDLDLSFRAQYSFYQTDATGNRIDRFLTDRIDWSRFASVFGSRWARCTYFSADLNFRVAGKAGSAASGAAGPAVSQDTPGPDLDALRNVPGSRFDSYGDLGADLSMPWSLFGSLSYTENRSRPMETDRTFWVNGTLDFKLSRNWKVSYRTQVDLELKKAVSQDISLFRDLHCWEAQVLWTPTGYNKRFYLRINIKSSMLKDLKFEKGTGRQGLYGY